MVNSELESYFTEVSNVGSGKIIEFKGDKYKKEFSKKIKSLEANDFFINFEPFLKK